MKSTMDYCRRGQPNGANAMGLSTVKPAAPDVEGDEWRKAQQKYRRNVLAPMIVD